MSNIMPSSLLFYFTTVLSSMMMISSSNWLMMWVSMEINLMSFIPLMIQTNKNRELESAIKYFLIQSMSSILMLATVFLFNNSMMVITSTMIMVASMMTKMGAAPFHIWLPQVMNNLSWIMCLLLLTLQKLGPLMLTIYSLNMWNTKMLTMLVLLNMIMGNISGINQTQMRSLLSYSSISHMGWMLSTMLMSPIITIYYFIMYCIMSMMIIIPMNKYLKTKTNSFNNNTNSKDLNNKFLSLNMMSMGGMPPMIGFIPKWLAIEQLINMNLFLCFMLLMFSMLSLYFYMKISMSSFLNFNFTMKNTKWNNSHNLIVLQLISPIMFMILIYCNMYNMMAST